MKKKTHEEFVQQVYELVGDEYEVLTPYQASKIPVQMRHCCGHEYPVRPSNFLSGKRCPECYNARRNQDKKKSPEIFLKEFNEKYEGVFVLMSEYQKVNEDVKVLCLKCQDTFEIAPNQLLHYQQTCPNCRDFVTNTTAFKHKVFNLVGEEYTVLGEYVNKGTHLLMRHEVCGYEYQTTPQNFTVGHRCPNCHPNRKITHEEFVKRVHDLVGEEYTVIGEFDGTKSEVEMRHNECEFTWKIVASSFIHRGNRCPQCSNRRPTVENCIVTVRPDIAIDWHPTKNINITPYECVPGSCFKVWWQCHKCEHEWEARVKDRCCDGRECPNCSPTFGKSKGEIYIKECLTRHGMKYKSQHTYADCRDKAALQFDVAVLSETFEVLCLIEFDGENHFYPIERFGGQEGHEETKRRDEIKNKYCEENNIILIRIPYWLRDHVDEVLTYWLKYYNIIA